MTPSEDRVRRDGVAGRVATDRSLATDGGRRADHAEDEDVVLVVDDDEAFAETVKIWLEPEMQVVLAHDGAQAVEAYRPSVDAVLLDRRMPTMSGDEALKRIRAQGGNPSVAVMTALSPDDSVVDMEFDVYLQKPITRDDLVDAVETILRRTRYPDEMRRLFSLRSKLDAFETSHSRKQLAESAHYDRIESEFDRLSDRLATEIAGLNESETSRLERDTG